MGSEQPSSTPRVVPARGICPTHQGLHRRDWRDARPEVESPRHRDLPTRRPTAQVRASSKAADSLTHGAAYARERHLAHTHAAGRLAGPVALNHAYAPPQAGPPRMYCTISMPWPSGSITKNIRVP